LSVPHARGYLLLRRGGGLWGIANAAIDGLVRRGADYRIAVGGGALAADEILGVVEDLHVWPLAPAVRRFWPQPAAGLAVHRGEPVVVVDSGRLPAALQCGDDGNGGEGDRRDDGREGRD
jgi:hypothetical protein